MTLEFLEHHMEKQTIGGDQIHSYDVGGVDIYYEDDGDSSSFIEW